MRVHYASRLAAMFLPSRFVAITLGRHVFTPLTTLPPHILRHEAVHVRQWERHGYIPFLFRYLWFHFRCGYEHNPFEIDARRGEMPDAD